ncbi:MAG: vitamin K epoxide reductase family protein, partial [Bradymonadaceae bacterium]
MRPRPLLIVALVGALGGLVFAGFSTYDFARHLDRQVHSVHCSFVPGLGEKEVGGSGCEATLKSPYSSFLRTYVWGGVPISLPAMSVFAFLIFFGADIFLAGRQTDPRATGFYALGSMLPVLASAVMGYLSFAVIDAACKLCIGIYVSSAVTAIGAVGLWLRAGGVSFGGGSSLGGSATPRGGDPAWVDEVDEEDDSGEMEETDPLDYEPGGGSRGPDGPTSWGKLAGAFGLGVLFVAVPVGAYVTAAP